MKQVTRKLAIGFGVAAMALTGMAGVAYAQRDPAYEAARANGQVGEKMDGYLGIVGASNADLQRMVNDINIRRRAVYAEKAQAAGVGKVAFDRSGFRYHGRVKALAEAAREQGLEF